MQHNFGAQRHLGETLRCWDNDLIWSICIIWRNDAVLADGGSEATAVWLQRRFAGNVVLGAMAFWGAMFFLGGNGTAVGQRRFGATAFWTQWCSFAKRRLGVTTFWCNSAFWFATALEDSSVLGATASLTQRLLGCLRPQRSVNLHGLSFATNFWIRISGYEFLITNFLLRNLGYELLPRIRATNFFANFHNLHWFDGLVCNLGKACFYA